MRSCFSCIAHENFDFAVHGEFVVGRMYGVSPREGERYFIRVLLLHTSGKKSFEDLRMVDGAESFNKHTMHPVKNSII